MDLEQKIEAILFFKGEPISLKRLEDILSAQAGLRVSKEEIENAVSNLKNSLQNRGIVLVEREDELMLGTAPLYSKLIEDLQKEELNRELSKASLETLSIVLYKNGATRAEIDYIRGVNSTFTLRILSVRGLVEKTVDPKDNRRFIYKPSFALISYLGMKSVEELPDWGEVNNSIATATKNMEDLSAQARETKKEEGIS